MSRRVPALAMLATLAVATISAQEAAPAAATGQDSVIAPTAAVFEHRDTVVADSAPSVAALPDSVQILVFPLLQDSLGMDSSLPSVFRDVLVQTIGSDSMPHGRVEGWLGAQPSSIAEADSFGSGASAIVWVGVVASDSGMRTLQARLLLRANDSVLASTDIPFPDTAEHVLTSLPQSVLLGLFPRKMAPRPQPVSLADSVKRVAVLPFLAEGTASTIHAALFTDSLSHRIHGLDGFSVLPTRLRDSLLSGWEPGQCLTASCRHEAGERLGVQWVVAGRIGQLGDKWTVRAELVRVDSASVARNAVVQCQGAPIPSLKLATGMTARQLAGKELPRKEFSDAPVARDSQGPAWARILALSVATVLGVIGVALSW